jgi:hypothetical protein
LAPDPPQPRRRRPLASGKATVNRCESRKWPNAVCGKLQRHCRRAFWAAKVSELPTSALVAWCYVRSPRPLATWQREPICRAVGPWADRVRRDNREWVWRLTPLNAFARLNGLSAIGNVPLCGTSKPENNSGGSPGGRSAGHTLTYGSSVGVPIAFALSRAIHSRYVAIVVRRRGRDGRRTGIGVAPSRVKLRANCVTKAPSTSLTSWRWQAFVLKQKSRDNTPRPTVKGSKARARQRHR